MFRSFYHTSLNILTTVSSTNKIYLHAQTIQYGLGSLDDKWEKWLEFGEKSAEER